MSDNTALLADPVETALAQFSMAFTVRDLMVPCGALIRADTVEEGEALSKKHGCDVIPYPQAGSLTGYYYQGSQLTLLTPADLVGDSTSLLDLLSLLARREFFFVLRGNEIGGYVHFSDLNKPLMRTPLYMLLEATERHLLAILRQSFQAEDAEHALGHKRVKVLQGYLRTATEKRADTSLWDVLGLQDILTIAITRGLARVSETEQINESQAKELVEFRNGIAHSGLLLVDGHDAVARLMKLRQFCAQLRLLNSATSKRADMG